MESKVNPVALRKLATSVRRLLCGAVKATTVGGPAPVTQEFSERAREPRIGDLVAEESTVVWSPGRDIDAVGYLEEIAREKVVFEGDQDFVWDEEEEGRPHPTEKVFYIRTFDGRRMRWVNASFVAAPVDFFKPLAQ